MKHRKYWPGLLVKTVCSLALLGASALGGAHAAELKTFKFASVGDKPTSAAELYYGLGLEKGWYKEVGVDFQVVRMFSSVAYPAILSGEVDGTLYAASSAVAALRGAKLAVVFEDPVSVPWSLVVDPKKIKTPQDLKGARCVAATGAKTAMHIAWAALIDSIGGDPRNFQPVGLGQPTPYWIEALRSGTAPCMMGFDAAWTGQAEREGFKALAYLPDVMSMPGNGMTVAQAALKDPARREVIKNVLSVFLRAQDYVRDPANRTELAGIVAKWMGNPKGIEQKDYENVIDELAKLLPPKGYLEDEQIFGNMIRVAIKYGIYDAKEFSQDPTTTDLVKEGVVDQSLLKEVLKRGNPYKPKS